MAMEEGVVATGMFGVIKANATLDPDPEQHLVGQRLPAQHSTANDSPNTNFETETGMAEETTVYASEIGEP